MSNSQTTEYNCKYYYLDEDQYNALKDYADGNFIVSDFIYVSPEVPNNHNGLYFAPAGEISEEELDFLYENDAVNFMWFRYSNQPSRMY